MRADDEFGAAAAGTAAPHHPPSAAGGGMRWHVSFVLGVLCTLLVLRLQEGGSGGVLPGGGAGLSAHLQQPASAGGGGASSTPWAAPTAQVTALADGGAGGDAGDGYDDREAEGTGAATVAEAAAGSDAPAAPPPSDADWDADDGGGGGAGPPVPTPVRGEEDVVVVTAPVEGEQPGGDAEQQQEADGAEGEGGYDDGASSSAAAAGGGAPGGDPVPPPSHAFVCVQLKPTAGAGFDALPVHPRGADGKPPPWSRDVAGLAIGDVWNVTHCYAPPGGSAGEGGGPPPYTVRVAAGGGRNSLRRLRRVGLSGKVILTRVGARRAGSRRRGPGRELVAPYPSRCDWLAEYALPRPVADTYASLVFSRSPHTLAYGRHVAGPDEVAAELEGPELLSLAPAFNPARCEYVFHYALTLPGRYRLRLSAHRGAYAALAEVAPRVYPESSYDNIGGDGLWVLAVGPVPGLLQPDGRSLLVGPSTLDAAWRHVTQDAPAGQPACRGRGRLPAGRWVAAAPPSGVLRRPGDPPLAFQRALPLPPALVRRWWTDPRAYAWLPYDCRPPPRPSRAAARACLAGKRLLVAGDSHDRGLFNALAGWLWGAGGGPPPLPPQFHATRCFSLGADNDWSAAALERHGGMALDGDDARSDAARAVPLPPQLCFAWNHLGDPAGLHLLGGHWDAVVAGFGHHPANGSNRWSLDRWRSAVARLFRSAGATLRVVDARARHEAAAAAAGAAGAPPPPVWRLPRLVWHTIPAPPVRKDGHPVAHGDGRTLTRLRAMNAAAAEAADAAADAYPPLAAALTVLDAWAWTLPLVELAGDSVHYDGFPPYVEAALDALVGALCGGGG
jgi:hypothetical protein